MKLSKRIKTAVFSALGIGGVIAASALVIAPQPAAAAFDADDVVRGAFYSTSYPEQNAWATKYNPSLGKYSSTNTTIMASHVGLAKAAGLDAFIAPFDGENSSSESRFQALSGVAGAQNFKVAAWYTGESRTTAPTQDTLNADFNKLYSMAEDDLAWLRRDDKPVVFVYNTGPEANCAAVDRIKAAETASTDFHIAMKVFTGYSTCASQPDSWYQYAPNTGYSVHGTQSAVVSPGYFKFDTPTAALPRDMNRFVTDLERQKATGAKWQLLATFNNWADGSSVESANEWSSPSGLGNYLDAVQSAYVLNPTPQPTVTTPPPASGDKVIWAAGDACDDQASAISDTQRGCKLVGNMIKADNATSKFLALGDTQYENGEAVNYTTYYDVGLGKQQKFAGSTESIWDRTIAAVGNHEYNTTGAVPYYNYFGTAKSGDPTKGYFTTDLGKWRILSLNSNCSKITSGTAGCGPTSSQGIWLKGELDAATAAGDHTIVIFHHPPFTDGANYAPGTTSGVPLWESAYDNGADIVLTGHDHQYQRFGQIAKDGSANTTGPQYWVVGTGGKGNTGFSTLSGTDRTLYEWGISGSLPGALRLVVKDNGTYTFEFKTSDGVVRDSGSGSSR